MLQKLLALQPEQRPSASHVADVLLGRQRAQHSPTPGHGSSVCEEVSAPPSAFSGKRKRDAFSDLFCASFPEEDSSKIGEHLLAKLKTSRSAISVDKMKVQEGRSGLRIGFNKRISFNYAESWVKRDFPVPTSQVYVLPLPPSTSARGQPAVKHLSGERGDCCLASVLLDKELCEFLLEEIGAADLQQYNKTGKKVGGAKEFIFSVSGSTGRRLNGQPCSGPLPFLRLRAWAEWLTERNGKVLAKAQRNLRRALNSEKSKNGQWFLEEDITSWFLEALHLRISFNSSAGDEAHFDPPSAVFQFWVCLSGSSAITFYEKNGKAGVAKSKEIIFVSFFSPKRC